MNRTGSQLHLELIAPTGGPIILEQTPSLGPDGIWTILTNRTGPTATVDVELNAAARGYYRARPAP